MIDDNDIDILETIVKKKGDCLKAELCKRCPFAHKCLPEMIKNNKKYRPSKQERMNMALDVLTNSALLEDSQEYVREL